MRLRNVEKQLRPCCREAERSRETERRSASPDLLLQPMAVLKAANECRIIQLIRGFTNHPNSQREDKRGKNAALDLFKAHSEPDKSALVASGIMEKDSHFLRNSHGKILRLRLRLGLEVESNNIL